MDRKISNSEEEKLVPITRILNTRKKATSKKISNKTRNNRNRNC